MEIYLHYRGPREDAGSRQLTLFSFTNWHLSYENIFPVNPLSNTTYRIIYFIIESVVIRECEGERQEGYLSFLSSMTHTLKKEKTT